MGAILIVIHPLHILGALVQLLMSLLLEIVHHILILTAVVLKLHLVGVVDCLW